MVVGCGDKLSCGGGIMIRYLRICLHRCRVKKGYGEVEIVVVGCW